MPYTPNKTMRTHNTEMQRNPFLQHVPKRQPHVCFQIKMACFCTYEKKASDTKPPKMCTRNTLVTG